MSGWKHYFRLGADFREQEGQAATFELAANVQIVPGQNISWLFQLVTGYGKTLATYGVFWILKQRGLVDNLLVLVPSDDQRTQFAGAGESAQTLLGVNLTAWVVEKKARECRMARTGECKVFVATYQQLRDEGDYFHDLLDTGGRWAVALDECHHLGEDGRWADRQLRLPNVVCRWGLSATPVRSDLKRLLGVPSTPNVRVDYKRAFREKVVKRVIGHIDHYHLDVDVNGEHTRITTESLRQEEVTDFNQYETRRQLRYNDSYLNRMLIEPLQDLTVRNSRYPGENQMVVFCMSCRHANHVCDQINTLVTDMGMPVRAEWVGVGEGKDGQLISLEQNRALLKRFKEGGFEVLVQVAKAAEGFDVKRVSVLLFLHLIGADSRLIQQIGRGLRRNAAIPFDEDTVSVFASADTPIADVIRSMEVEADEVEPRERESRGATQLRLFDIPDLLLIAADYDRTDYVGAHGVDLLTPTQVAFCQQFNIPIADYIRHWGGTPNSGRTSHVTPPRTPQSELISLELQVKKNTSILCGNILQLILEPGQSQDKKTVGKIAGQIKRCIHTTWIHIAGLKHDAMTASEFNRKNEWLQSVNRQIKETREVPSWVTSLSRAA